MSQLSYKEALTKVKEQEKEKQERSPFLTFSFDYATKIILPYEQGVVFLKTLENAELLVTKYNPEGSASSIHPFCSTAVSVSPLSSESYYQIKIAQLLNVPLEEVKELG